MVFHGYVRGAVLVLLVSGGGAVQAADAPGVPDTISFNRHIRPILSDKCFACHGPDARARKADLRLDMAPPPAAAGPDGLPATPPVLVPGDPDQSELIRRVMSADPDEKMPPPDQERQLTDQQRALLRAWVAQGAQYEPHWSYMPLRDDELTRPADYDAYANPIDSFVNRRLAREGLPVSEPADPTTLVRRVHWDLLGLPPTPAVADGFRANHDPADYEALVDSLLASPHFGERMAIDWLDAVRYADTNGYHSDEVRRIYPYRDYVIRAFNENMPFDRFTREQLAGDLFLEPTRDQLIASGYNRLNQITAEGGAQAKEYLAKYAADRVRTTGTVWLGTTMGCAECHDHKYDPVTTKDFYSFAAFFADLEEKGVYHSGDIWAPRIYLPTPDQERAEAEIVAAMEALEGSLATYTPALEAARTAWEDEIRAQRAGGASPWRHPMPSGVKGEDSRTEFAVREDARIVAGGLEKRRDTYTVEYPAENGAVTALLLEALNDADLGGLSRGGSNFVLTGLALSYRKPDGTATEVSLDSATADFEQEGFPVAAALDKDNKSGWAVNAHIEKVDHAAVFRLAAPLTTEAGGTLVVQLQFRSDFDEHQLDSFRLGFTADTNAARASWHLLPKPMLDAITAGPEARLPEQSGALAKYFLNITPLLDDARQQLAARAAERETLRSQMATTLIAKAMEQPREIRILPRGNWLDESGPVVEPATPESLPAMGVAGRRATRMDLANWLVRDDNPLTARVTMNRLWKRFFGTGLSKVLDDVGAQGEWPTHPDLLDWLAREFIQSGWDMKHMVRLIVTSEAYKRSSTAAPEAVARDPYNRLLAHQSRFRLEAELVRDGALAVSGLLSRDLGGRSVYPYQPEGYYANCNTFGGELSYNTEQDKNQYRRGLYTFWKRSFLHPSMLAFDAPTREECTAERTVSNTPLQALVLLNDPTYVEAARVFAQRFMTAGGDRSDERIAAAFRIALSRDPSEAESLLLRNLYHAHLMEYTEDPAAAEALVTTGIAPVPETVDRADLAAWTSVARVILNLHETITRG
jgi:hypothetical protein